MEITTTLYVENRAQWRAWLEKNGATVEEIWLLYPLKKSGRARIPYDEAVEESLCFGWIDGIEKPFDADTSAQRFTPRRAKSNWSQLNKERARRLIENGQMTAAGLAKMGDLTTEFQIAPDILAALQADAATFAHFQAFPAYYQRVRIGFIEEVRKQPDVFEKRLANFLKMTAQNKRFGTLR